MRPIAATIALLALASLATTSARAAPPPKLVVIVVVDQLASHQWDRFAPLFTHGLGPLSRRGATYVRGTYAYANTETAPGHTTLVTGVWPNIHGLVGNHWFDATGLRVGAFSDPEHGSSPAMLTVPTIADALRIAQGGKGKVVSIGLKSRSVIPLGGQRPDLAIWYDRVSGRFRAGSWPGLPKPSAWVDRALLSHSPASSFGQTWNRIDPKQDYDALVGPDDRAYEEDVPGLGRTFPHVSGKGQEGPSPQWREDVYPATPASLDAVLRLAEASVREEKLGRGPHTDLLAVTIGQLDYAGHYWGPYSHEALDMLLRIDRGIGALVREVEGQLGQGGTLWVVSSDHGMLVPPEQVSEWGFAARRWDEVKVAHAVEAAFQEKDGVRVLDVNTPRVFLTTTAAAPAQRQAQMRAAAAAISKVPGILEAHATEDVGNFAEPFATYYRRSLYPGRSGEVLIRHAAHDYVAATTAEGAAVGSDHGSPYGYDTTVPVIFAGPGVRPALDARPHDMTRVAPTIAALLHIAPPATATEAPLPVADP